MTTKEDMDISRTILAQLGGSRFIAMTGASNFVGGESALTFRIPSRGTRKRGSLMKITLRANDTYRMEYMRVKNFEVVPLDEVEGVQVQDIRTTFTRITGLDTSLGRAA